MSSKQSNGEYPPLSATKVENGKRAMKRMKEHLGDWPTTTEWRNHKDEVNISTGPSDVGTTDGFTFVQIRNLAMGKDAGESKSTRGRESKVEQIPLPDNISISLSIDCDGEYDDEADAYIYTLKMRTEEDVWYYVGSTKNIFSRMRSHYRKNGDFSKRLDVHNISLHHITSLYRVFETNQEFEAKIRDTEREEYLETAINKGTTNVLGGK